MQPFDDHHQSPAHHQEKKDHHFSYRLLQGLIIGLFALSLLGCISYLAGAKPDIHPESKDIHPENRLILEQLYGDKNNTATEPFRDLGDELFDNYHNNTNEPSDQTTKPQ